VQPEGEEAPIVAVPVADLDAAPVSGSAAAGDEAAPVESGDREGGRRRRGRDRHRRERREDDVPTGVEAASEAATLELPAAAQAEAEPTQTPTPRPVAPVAPVAEAVVPRAAAPAPAVVEPFELPTGELQAVAEAAGLQWVNSDSEKIRAAQEAMANEPKPVHVPREIKPVAAIDEGPLVLVETRKDLAQFKLPFENQRPTL
jgi:ribonuclease E